MEVLEILLVAGFYFAAVCYWKEEKHTDAWACFAIGTALFAFSRLMVFLTNLRRKRLGYRNGG